MRGFILGGIFAALILHARFAKASADSNGINGINSSGLSLTGMESAIWQVETTRPGDPGPGKDESQNLFNSTVDPEQVFFRQNNSNFAPNYNLVNETDDHAMRVAGVMISTDALAQGVAQEADLLSIGLNPQGGVPLETTYEHVAVSTNHNDGMINGADLAETHFGPDDDDAEGDGDSDGADFLVWQRNVGLGSAAPSTETVPEPAAWLLGAVGLAFLMRRRAAYPVSTFAVVCSFATDGLAADPVMVPLAHMVTTSGQEGMQQVNEVLRRANAEKENKITNRYLGQIHEGFGRSGASNAFLVDATNLHDAIRASAGIYAGSRSASTPAAINQSHPVRGSHWLIASLACLIAAPYDGSSIVRRSRAERYGSSIGNRNGTSQLWISIRTITGFHWANSNPEPMRSSHSTRTKRP